MSVIVFFIFKIGGKEGKFYRKGVWSLVNFYEVFLLIYFEVVLIGVEYLYKERGDRRFFGFCFGLFYLKG